MIMRGIGAAFIAATLFASSAFAANNVVAPLPSGKPAGVKQAAMLGPNAFLILVGLGVVIGGVALSVSNSDHNTPTTPSTNGTGS
jgi:hypothetical protein